jgi:hypothetical protein
MYIRIGKTDFLLTHVEGKSLTELTEMFGHLHESEIKALHKKVGKKEVKTTNKK